MSETNLWKWLSESVLPEGHYSRIESPDTAPGFPDVHYQIRDDISGTLELKFARRPNARVPFKNERDGLHKSQKVWIRQELHHGGTVWIVAQVQDWIFVIPGRYAERFNGASVRELESMSSVILNRKRTPEAARDMYHTLKEI